MTVTFQSGMYFDPMYGWRSEKPIIKKEEDTLPTVAIDESMAYIVDDHLQEVIDRLKAAMDAQREIRKEQYQAMLSDGNSTIVPDDISYSMDKMVYGDVKNTISFDGNKMTVNVNLRRSYYILNTLSNYEEHRKNILNLKNNGYCDDAINMLLKELDNQFVSYACRGLTDQLQGLGYSESDAKSLATAFNKEYLRIRGSTGSVEGDAQKALNNLNKSGLPKVDIHYGKPGHYGILPPGYNDPRTPPELIEGYFKMMEVGEAWMEEQERRLPAHLTLSTPGTIQYNGEKLPKTI